jgi:DNA-directed RNA polymerase subunit E'/Rpb7
MAYNKDIFIRSLLHEKVKLQAMQINKNFRLTILQELQSKVEGRCTKHGFIKNKSVEIYQIHHGEVEMASLNGNMAFPVKFYAEVCNPATGSVIKCRVSNLNKFGILAEVKPVLEIIIAKNSASIKSDVDLDAIKIGDEILVEVVGKKYEIGDTRISVVGRVVTSPQNARIKRSIKAIQPSLVAAEIEENDDDYAEVDDISHKDDDRSEGEVDVEDDGSSSEDDDEEVEDDEEGDDFSEDEAKKGAGGFFDSDVEDGASGGGYEASEADSGSSDEDVDI